MEGKCNWMTGHASLLSTTHLQSRTIYYSRLFPKRLNRIQNSESYSVTTGFCQCNGTTWDALLFTTKTKQKLSAVHFMKVAKSPPVKQDLTWHSTLHCMEKITEDADTAGMQWYFKFDIIAPPAQRVSNIWLNVSYQITCNFGFVRMLITCSVIEWWRMK